MSEEELDAVLNTAAIFNPDEAVKVPIHCVSQRFRSAFFYEQKALDSFVYVQYARDALEKMRAEKLLTADQEMMLDELCTDRSALS